MERNLERLHPPTDLEKQLVSKDPETFQKEIIEYESRMRVFGLEKFNGPCYLSVVNYYLTQGDLDAHKSCGTFILYLEEESTGKLLKSLGYSGFTDEDEDIVMDKCSEFCKILAENFKNELVPLGFRDLVISAPTKHKNDVYEGVEFPYSEYGMHEAHFYLLKKKTVFTCARIS